MRRTFIALAGAIALAVPRLTSAQSPSSQIPLVRGLTIVSALHFADGDRENAVRVGDISPAGVTYSWRFRERRANGDTVEESFARLVSPNDMASAPRLNPIFQRGMAREETPGYTAVSLS